MANEELRERAKKELFCLLKIERLNHGNIVAGLQEEIFRCKQGLTKEDITAVEHDINIVFPFKKDQG